MVGQIGMAAAEDDFDELGDTDVCHERDSQDGPVPYGERDEPRRRQRVRSAARGRSP